MGAIQILPFLGIFCLSCCAYQVPNNYRTQQHHTNNHFTTQQMPCSSRRAWVQKAAQLVVSGGPILLSTPPTSFAVTTTSSSTNAQQDPTKTIDAIKAAKKTLQTLLDNWENAVIECIYADVPRELLEQKNKELLLEKASTYALFDKSVSVVTCKTNNKNIRDYIGRTGIGPLVGLDKQLRKALDLVEDPDDLDAFVQASESVQQALSRADSYSYTAGGDTNAVNNFDKAKTQEVLETNANLKQVQSSVQTAIDGLDEILRIVEKT
jgi:hypothetical protein